MTESEQVRVVFFVKFWLKFFVVNQRTFQVVNNFLVNLFIGFLKCFPEFRMKLKNC